MRVQNTSATSISNIFIDESQFESYMITPVINGVSDHDAQLLTINTNYSYIPNHKSKMLAKLISTLFLILLIN